MSAMGAEDESGTGTVREEGVCAEVKAAEVTAMSPQAHKLSHLRSTHDPVPPPSPDIIFDRSFSTRSSVGESSPFRKSLKTRFSVLGGGRGVGRGDLKIPTSSIER